MRQIDVIEFIAMARELGRGSVELDIRLLVNRSETRCPRYARFPPDSDHITDAPTRRKVPKREICPNTKLVDAPCVFRAAKDSTCRMAGALRHGERTW